VKKIGCCHIEGLDGGVCRSWREREGKKKKVEKNKIKSNKI